MPDPAMPAVPSDEQALSKSYVRHVTRLLDHTGLARVLKVLVRHPEMKTCSVEIF